MLRKLFRKIRPRKGQSILEFAMIVPLLLVIFMGVFDFGWILHRQITMDNATRAAARRGAVGENTENIVQLVKDSVYFELTDDQIDVSVLDPYYVDIGNANEWCAGGNWVETAWFFEDMYIFNVSGIDKRNLIGS